ncbi:MAG: DUF1847 domain-containing protein [Lachnospiraceae bacterium]|nr:DUF1847 domain-containing protein [Lachnospiraceae bacterium]
MEGNFSCADCYVKACRSASAEKYPAFCPTKDLDPDTLREVLDKYGDEETEKITVTSACVESEFYCRLTRVEETIQFIERMGYHKIGVATCAGLLTEARTFTKILRAHNLDVYTVCCKCGAVDKTAVGIPEEKKLNGGGAHESMCNPILQAKLLEEKETEFNVVIGLCVGHDTLFLKHSAAPVTVLIVKDRVLGHNPVQALYMANTRFSRFKKELGPGT